MKRKKKESMTENKRVWLSEIKKRRIKRRNKWHNRKLRNKLRMPKIMKMSLNKRLLKPINKNNKQ